MGRDEEIIARAYYEMVQKNQKHTLIDNHLNSKTMKELTLSRAKAMQIFRKASDEVKKLMQESAPSDFFAGRMIDRLKTYEDFYNEADPETQKEATIYPTDLPYIVAEKKLILIARVINFNEETGKQFIPSLADTDQKKWFPVFVLSSGSGFDYSVSNYFCTYALTGAGLRLCFETKEKCEYVARQFIDLYEQYITIK
jgi:hypothetical protein